jgi:DNA topoisomerase-6 subunit B
VRLPLNDTTEWPEPSGDALSPAGIYNLYLGIMKEIKPDMIATHVERAHVFQGHAFIVEAAVSIGGKTVESGVNVYRFANRIPLLFEGGSDVITRTANELKCENGLRIFPDCRWAQYKINKNEDRIGVFVSLVSTKIPFKV